MNGSSFPGADAGIEGGITGCGTDVYFDPLAAAGVAGAGVAEGAGGGGGVAGAGALGAAGAAGGGADGVAVGAGVAGAGAAPISTSASSFVVFWAPAEPAHTKTSDADKNAPNPSLFVNTLSHNASQQETEPERDFSPRARFPLRFSKS